MKTLQEYQKEYNLMALQLGDIKFKQMLLDRQLTDLHARMMDLNSEAESFVKAQKEKDELNGPSQAL